MKILGVIPARYASTRFPGKPLIDINGKSMINRVFEQARKATTLSKVVVATDDIRIFDHVKAFGGEVLMTSEDHQNGTSRCLEVLEKLNENYDAVVNIQGDEPYIEPSQIDKVSSLFAKPETQIATLAKKINSANELFDQNIVKLVFNNQNIALYFSRQSIPLMRDLPKKDWLSQLDFYKHIGIYGYRTDILKEISRLEPGKIEMAEKLEQLRWLENSYQIKVDITDSESIAVDTPEDLLKFNNNL